VARKRTQAKRSSSSKRKSTSSSSSSRRKTKSTASRSTAKRTTSRSKTKSTSSRSKTKSSGSRSKTKSSGRSKTKSSGSRSKTKSSGSRSKTKSSGSSRSGSRGSSSRSKTKSSSSRSRSKTSGSARRSAQASAKTISSLDDVLMEQLADLRSAEQQLVTALPKVARAASNPNLRSAFETHLEETRGHVRRLEEIFTRSGMRPPQEECKAMKGLIEEAEDVIEATGDPNAKDAALIAAAQRVEHYEIAAYGTARTLAGQLGQNDAQGLLEETLEEEGRTDELLTQLATGGIFRTGINEQAAE
jgi:ferritin-like metal-binding protein YciE